MGKHMPAMFVGVKCIIIFNNCIGIATRLLMRGLNRIYIVGIAGGKYQRGFDFAKNLEPLAMS
jgi:hypothetical protein